MEETVEPEIYDGPLDEPVTERLDQISKKLDGLNKCSISTVQMAKKVYAGLEEVKQVSGNHIYHILLLSLQRIGLRSSAPRHPEPVPNRKMES
jgi:hypothetical protein